MNEQHKAAIWMVGAILSFSTMALAGREISVELDTFELMFFRSLIGIAIVTCVATLSGTLHQISPAYFGQHIFRNLAHFGGQNLWFYAVTVIPLAQVAALEFTAPLWVLFLSVMFLGERLNKIRLLAASLGFIGVVIVAQPTPDTLSWGVASAASCAVFFAITAIVTRKLTERASITCILFWLVVMQSVFGLVTAGIDGDIAMPTGRSIPLVIVISCAGLTAHFSLTKALQLAPASFVMPLDFARLPVLAIAGALVYAEALELAVFVGAGLIFFANYLNVTSRQN